MLAALSTPECKIRWFRSDDYNYGYLQLISLQPLLQLAKPSKEGDEQKHKPYENKDELEKDFNQMFPARKEDLKIIVVEVDERIVFSICLYIDEGKGLGYIHDLMLNMQLYR